MICLRTLGQLTLQQDEKALAVSLLGQPKRLALLAYLAAVHPAAPRSRDTLIALLWPEQDETHARTGLRQALLGLRRHLGAEAFTGMGDERVGVDPAHLWCDAAVFTAAIGRGDHVEALALYKGPFLDGFHLSDAPEFERWVERERRRLELEAIAAAWHLVDASEAEGDESSARRWAERAIELAPYDEMGFRRYLGVLERQADAAAAITAFAAYRRRLLDDLGLEPSDETNALIERFRNNERTARQSVAGVLSAASERPVAADDRKSAATVPTARQSQRWIRLAVGAASVVALGGAVVAANWLRTDPVESEYSRTAIAVLPFRNLSTDSAHAYFAAGFQDELMTQLGKVSSLRLIGRTSVSGYQPNSKPLRQIGEELGVGAIVEASVQIVDNRFRIVVHLVDPETEEDLWTERYERTLDDAFAVQSEIAQRIVAAVGSTLSGSEAAAISAVPTQNAAAYQLYLQGLEYSRRPGLRPENDRAAQRLFEQALAVDSTFAPAHSELAFVHWRTYDLKYDRTPARLARARQESETALRLAPGLAQAHLTIGLARYVSTGDFRRALEEFRVGLRAAPNDALLWASVGHMHMHLGNWDSATVAHARALSLEPRDATLRHVSGEIHHFLHRYPEAIEAYRNAFALAPDFVQARLSMAWSYILWQGQMDTLRAVLRELPPDGEPGAGGGPLLDQRLILMKFERNPDSLLMLLRAHGGSMSPLDRALNTGEAYQLRRDTVAARAVFDSALAMIDAKLRESPDDEGLHHERANVLGRLGRRADAVQEIRWLKRTRPKIDSRLDDGWSAMGRLLAIAGETDAALAEIERMLASPSGLTATLLRLDPAFDGIRNDPRFQRLLVKYANPPRF
ncbi:MAG TPA: BTAD domain-containing putative transcriptional regulator [Longimicrobiales bacterium]